MQCNGYRPQNLVYYFFASLSEYENYALHKRNALLVAVVCFEYINSEKRNLVTKLATKKSFNWVYMHCQDRNLFEVSL